MHINHLVFVHGTMNPESHHLSVTYSKLQNKLAINMNYLVVETGFMLMIFRTAKLLIYSVSTYLHLYLLTILPDPRFWQ